MKFLVPRHLSEKWQFQGGTANFSLILDKVGANWWRGERAGFRGKDFIHRGHFTRHMGGHKQGSLLYPLTTPTR